MQEINRRKFLKVAGTGAAGAAALAAMAPLANLVFSVTRDGILSFRAIAGLPQKPFAWATYVLEGRVDVMAKSGVVTKTLFAGPPEVKSTIALPGLTRTVRLTDVSESNGTLQIKGVMDDRTQLMAGESSTVSIVIDRVRGTAKAQFFETGVSMRLEDAGR